MKNAHIGIMFVCFVTILVSLYYGVTIQNAQDNFLIEHLNIDEGQNYAALEEIPTLNFKAALVTLFFLSIGFGVQIYVYLKTPYSVVKKLAIGAFVCFISIFIFDFLTLSNPIDYNFKHYGMIWVLLSLSIVFINGVSIFMRK